MAIITIKDLAGKIKAIPASTKVSKKEPTKAEKEGLAREREERKKILEKELRELKIKEPDARIKIIAKEKQIEALKK